MIEARRQVTEVKIKDIMHMNTSVFGLMSSSQTNKFERNEFR